MVIILYRMAGAFHLLGQIVHGLSKRKPKFRTSKFLSRNCVYHLHKSVPLTEKRPRKPESGKLVFHVHFGKWKAPNVSEILLVFSLEVRAFSQQDASKVGC